MLGNGVTRKLVEKILKKVVAKKLGGNIDITVDQFSLAQSSDESILLNVQLYAKIPQAELLKMIETGVDKA